MSTEVRLSREMRLLDVTMIGVGAMIGAGIFVLTGIAAGVAGPGLILVFLLNGLVAFLTAAAYAELGSAVHGAGGGYLWIKASLPDPSGFLAGWMDWFAHAVACSLYALGFGAYFREVLNVAGAPHFAAPVFPEEIWYAIGACTLFAIINYRGASEAGKAGNVVTIAKVLIIGVFIAVGLWVMVHRPGWQGTFRPFLSEGWTGVFMAMGLTFIAFEGYEIIAQTSEEVENPKKNIPRAVFISLVIVIPIYLLVAFVAIGAVIPPPGMAITQYLAQGGEVALVSAADQFFLGGGIMILVGGLLSTVSALNATIYSMARDGSLPRAIAGVHPKRGTPHFAIIFSAVLIVGMAISLPIADVAAAASVMFLLLFGGVNIALIRLRKLRPDLDRGFRVPFVPVTPILAVVTMLFIAGYMFVGYPLAWAAAGGWIVAGVGFYYAYARTREAALIERVQWMERLEKKEYRVLVAVASPSTMRSLVEVGAALARKHDGDLVMLAVVEVPEGESLLTGRRHVRAVEPLLERAVSYAEERGVKATSVVKIARRISQGILQTAREESCNFLLVGPPSGRSFLERMVASIGERVLQGAPCQVGVVYGSVKEGAISRVSVPVAHGANSRLAVELAPAMSDWFGAPTRLVTVVERGLTEAEESKARRKVAETLTAAGVDEQPVTLRDFDVGRALVSSVSPNDLVLIGAPAEGPISPVLGQTVPGFVATRSQGPVVVLRDVEPKGARGFERVFFRRG